jgi:hypothetical protein
MRLADVDSKTFGLVIHWMYQQKIAGGKEVGLLIAGKLWFLADRFMIRKLQNSAMDLVRDLLIIPSVPQLRELARLVSEVDVDSQLRKIVVTRLASQRTDNFQRMVSKLPAGLVADIAILLRTSCDNLPPQHWASLISSSTKFYVEASEEKEA